MAFKKHVEYIQAYILCYSHAIVIVGQLQGITLGGNLHFHACLVLTAKAGEEHGVLDEVREDCFDERCAGVNLDRLVAVDAKFNTTRGDGMRQLCLHLPDRALNTKGAY